MEKKYVFFKMTSAPIVDSGDDTDKNSVECQRFVITCMSRKTHKTKIHCPKAFNQFKGRDH